MHFRAVLTVAYDYTRCVFVNIRGFNKAGLIATVQKEIVNCDTSVNIVNANIVIDVGGKFILFLILSFNDARSYNSIAG